MKRYTLVLGALGISSRSLAHHWKKVGVAGGIPGYATHINGVARASKVIKYGGWIGTVIGGGCLVFEGSGCLCCGTSKACERVKLTETGSFVGTSEEVQRRVPF